MSTTYQALQITEAGQRELVTLATESLTENNVRIEVHYSSVNYKDALASLPKGGVIRSYPMTPGIDLSGVIIESNDPTLPVGKEVLVTSYGLGVTQPGGFSQIQTVPSDWVIPLPEGLSLKEAMIFGTAGYTAALAVQALETHGLKKESKIAVTGASGGVASCGIAFLHTLGYRQITAITRKTTAADWLHQLGTTEVVTPEAILPEKIKPLAKQQFDFLLDTVGGTTLSGLLPQISYGGAAALCGNASGIKIETTVLPFILRNINLLGVDSVNTPYSLRQEVWQRLAGELQVANQLQINQVTLDELPTVFDQLLAGTHEGRTIVKIKE